MIPHPTLRDPVEVVSLYFWSVSNNRVHDIQLPILGMDCRSPSRQERLDPAFPT